MAPRTLSATCDGWHTFNATIFDPVRIAAIAHLRYTPMRERGAIIFKADSPAEYRVSHQASAGLWQLLTTAQKPDSPTIPPQSFPNQNDQQYTPPSSTISSHAHSDIRKSVQIPQTQTQTPSSIPGNSVIISAIKRSAAHRRFAITIAPNRHFMLHPSGALSRHFVLCELHAGPSIVSQHSTAVPHPSEFEHNHDDEGDDGVQVASFNCDGIWKRSYTIHIERLIPDEMVVYCFWLINLMNRRANIRASHAHHF